MNLPETNMPSRQLVELLDRASERDCGEIREMDLDERERIQVRLIVEAARAIRQGPSVGFTLRQVANASGTSTQMIYTIFGGKEGLIQALWEASLELLAVKCQEIPNDLPPLERLLRLGRLYRQIALEDPVIYAALFGGSLSGLNPPDPGRLRNTDAFSLLMECIEKGMKAGALSAEDPEQVAEVFWAVAHGVIDFEIAGYFEDKKGGWEHYLAAQQAVIRGFGGEIPRFKAIDTLPGDG